MNPSGRYVNVKFTEQTKAMLQEEFDQKLQNALDAIAELQQTCIANQSATNTDPKGFGRLMDQLTDLRPIVI